MKRKSPADRKYVDDNPTDEQIEEIEERKKTIRERWTDEERMRRTCGVVQPWHAPEYKEGAFA